MKKYFLTTVLFVLVGLFINTNNLLSCQCPSDIPPTNVSWTSQGPVYIEIDDGNGHYCTFEVYYCWRQYAPVGPIPLLPVVEIWICDYDQTEECDEEFALAVWKISKKLAERIIVLNPNQLNWYYTPCQDPAFPNFATFSFDCWDLLNNPCGSTYCRISYDVRICQGQVLMEELGRERIGQGCSGNCTSHCED
jgi:hypothetical protein